MNRKFMAAALIAALGSFGMHAEGLGITADAGVAPTSMGTVGESLFLGLRLPPFFHLDLEGSRMKYLESAAEMELYGSDVFGDTSRDTLEGTVRLGAKLTFGRFSLNPWAFGAVDRSDSYTIVRLLEPGVGLPQDTSRFMDITAEEQIIDYGGGLTAGFQGQRFALQITGSLSPASLWNIESSRFLSGATWPVEFPTGLTNPTLYWSTRDEELSLSSYKYSLGGSLKLTPGRGAFAVGLFGGFTSLSYAGVSDIDNTGYLAYKNGDGVTPVDELPLQMTKTRSIDPARVELVRNSLEAGASLELLFLGALFKAKGSPAISVSWVNQTRTYDYRYLDASESLSAERWEEVNNFVKFALSFGVESF